MSAKQDRVASRTPEDVERKYNFGKTFAEVFGLAEDARRAAEIAQNAANEATDAVGNLDQDEIFKLLTNNGELKGLFMKDGELYINASYLATGIIKSENGKLVIDLSGESEPTFNTGISTNGLVVRGDEVGAERLFKVQATEIGEGKYTLNFCVYSTNGYSTIQRTSEIFSGGDFSEPNGAGTEWYSVDGKILAEVHATNNGAGMEFYLDDLCLGYLRGYTTGESALKATIINDKTVSWKDNGDGTFTLIGR